LKKKKNKIKKSPPSANDTTPAKINTEESLFSSPLSSRYISKNNIINTAGTWVFDAGDNIVNIYTSEMFFDLFRRVFVLDVIISSVFIIFGVLLRKRFIKYKVPRLVE
jgi:hypothetical protein